MTRVSLNPFNCPACRDGTIVRVDVDYDSIKEAKRLPAMVTVNCPKHHTLVLFVDGNFQVRDVEAAVESPSEDKDAIDKTGDWFSSL